MFNNSEITWLSEKDILPPKQHKLTVKNHILTQTLCFAIKQNINITLVTVTFEHGSSMQTFLSQ